VDDAEAGAEEIQLEKTNTLKKRVR
jgi:hypothetical protein